MSTLRLPDAPNARFSYVIACAVRAQYDVRGKCTAEGERQKVFGLRAEETSRRLVGRLSKKTVKVLKAQRIYASVR